MVYATTRVERGWPLGELVAMLVCAWRAMGARRIVAATREGVRGIEGIVRVLGFGWWMLLVGGRARYWIGRSGIETLGGMGRFFPSINQESEWRLPLLREFWEPRENTGILPPSTSLRVRMTTSFYVQIRRSDNFLG